MDRFNLRRFVKAQDDGATYEAALAELRGGRKRGHWMWFVFPQIAGLGYSQAAQRYALSGLAEASDYLAHPVLGPRLIACARALTGLQESDPVEVLGAVDAQKLKSCMTLFLCANPDASAFQAVLNKFFDGCLDSATTSRLEQSHDTNPELWTRER